MRRTIIGIFATSLAVLAMGAADDDQGFQPIFNGKDLSGWKVPTPNPWWEVKDGILVGHSDPNDPKKKGDVLYTEKSYKDVILDADCRWNGEIDSGFFFRKPDLQVQIGISRSLKKDMTGSLYGKDKYAGKEAKGVDKALKLGDWNHFKVEVKGNRWQVWLNGTEVLDWTDTKNLYKDAGPIGLQIHPGLEMKVEFKDLKVKEL